MKSKADMFGSMKGKMPPAASPGASDDDSRGPDASDTDPDADTEAPGEDDKELASLSDDQLIAEMRKRGLLDEGDKGDASESEEGDDSMPPMKSAAKKPSPFK